VVLRAERAQQARDTESGAAAPGQRTDDAIAIELTAPTTLRSARAPSLATLHRPAGARHLGNVR